MFTCNANLQAFLLDFYDIKRPQHEFFYENRGKKRLKIDWRVKIKCSGCYTFQHILYVFFRCCDLLDACTLENRQTIVFKFSRNYGAFLGENYFKFPTKYMKFPIFVGNLKNVRCVTFPLFSDKIKKKRRYFREAFM